MSYGRVNGDTKRFQPRQAYPIANTDLSKGLVSLAIPAIRYDLKSRKPVTHSGNTVLSQDFQGRHWQGASANSPVDIGVTGGISTLLDQTKEWSIAFRIYISDITTGQFVVSDMDAAGNNKGVEVLINAGSLIVGGYYSTTGLGNVYTLPGTGMYDVLATFTSGTAWTTTLYVNGALIGTTGAASGNVNAGTTLRLCNPGAYTGGSALLGKLYYCAFFQGDKSRYARALANDPWSLLEEPKAKIVLPSAAIVNGTGTGDIPSSSLSLVSGAAIGTAVATGSLTTISLDVPMATASGSALATSSLTT